MRRLRLRIWAARVRARMRWVDIRFRFEAGEGIVFVRSPFVLAGADPPRGTHATLTVRIGNRVRFAPGVVIEAEPGRDALLEIGDGTRVGANVRFRLRGGAVRIGRGCEIRDGCRLKTTEGVIELADNCFMSYGCILNATERVVVEERVAIGEQVILVDSGEEAPAEPVVVGADSLVFANAVITTGAHVGPSSQVAAGALVDDEHPPESLLAGAPARVVKSLADE